MAELVRSGSSMRTLASRFGVSLLTVQRWVGRAADCALDEVDWCDRPSAPRRTNHTPPSVEDEIVRLRSALRESVLGEYGPAAIHSALSATRPDRAGALG